MTIILVSHSMDDVARYVERIVVMGHGEKVFDDSPKNVFRHYTELEELGLSAPQITYIMNTLRESGFDVETDALTVEEAAEEIMRRISKSSR
jgi:energy-coupling factor transport system ATP-binding protein